MGVTALDLTRNIPLPAPERLLCISSCKIQSNACNPCLRVSAVFTGPALLKSPGPESPLRLKANWQLGAPVKIKRKLNIANIQWQRETFTLQKGGRGVVKEDRDPAGQTLNPKALGPAPGQAVGRPLQCLVTFLITGTAAFLSAGLHHTMEHGFKSLTEPSSCISGHTAEPYGEPWPRCHAQTPRFSLMTSVTRCPDLLPKSCAACHPQRALTSPAGHWTF